MHFTGSATSTFYFIEECDGGKKTINNEQVYCLTSVVDEHAYKYTLSSLDHLH